MIYPKFIKPNDTIGVTAISDGITSKEKLYRLNSAIKNMESINFKIKETPDVRTSEFAKSTNSKEQAKELINLFNMLSTGSNPRTLVRKSFQDL